MSNWTGTDGVDPRPYATAIKYYCRREGWGYASTGDNETTITCQWDGTWSNDANIETCVSKCRDMILISVTFYMRIASLANPCICPAKSIPTFPTF